MVSLNDSKRPTIHHAVVSIHEERHYRVLGREGREVAVALLVWMIYIHLFVGAHHCT